MTNQKNKRKIGIDARFYGPIGKGLGRYTQEIVDRVIRLDKENDYVIFLCKENYDTFILPRDGIKKILANARWYTLKEQIVLPFLIWRERIDLMHYTHFNVPIFTPVKFIVTIPDLILTKFPSVRATTLSPWFYKIKNLLYKIVIWTAAKRARKIIAVSEFTERDIIEYFKVKPEKVVMIYEGVTVFPLPPTPLPASPAGGLIRRGVTSDSESGRGHAEAADYVDWLLKETEADGVGIGQGALGRPWIFDEVKSRKVKVKSTKEIFKIALKHAKLMEKMKGEQGIIEMRKHLCWYVQGMPKARKMREELVKVESIEDIKKIFKQIS